MQFLRTVFWVVLAVLGVVFSIANWTPVTVTIWGGNVVDTRLPVLLIVTFLLGLLPMLVIHRTTRWSLRRRLDTANRTLTETQAATSSPVPATGEHPHHLDRAPSDVMSLVPPLGGD